MNLRKLQVMSKSVLRGEVELSPNMKEKWMMELTSTSHMFSNPESLKPCRSNRVNPFRLAKGNLLILPELVQSVEILSLMEARNMSR